MPSSFETDEFVRFVHSYLSSIKSISAQARKDIMIDVYSILAMADLFSSSELVEHLYRAVGGNISHKGIAESLFDEDFSFTGDKLRNAYNTYKSAVSADCATGIDYSVEFDGDIGDYRTTIDLYRNGQMVDFMDFYTPAKPDRNDLGSFFNQIAGLLDEDRDRIPVSAYLSLSRVIKDIDELEHEYVLKK
jgi:hypothetical protein